MSLVGKLFLVRFGRPIQTTITGIETELHNLSHTIMGWPPGVRWYYPMVYDWDEDIPAYIMFFRNPERWWISDQDQIRLKALLNRLFPGPYDLDWTSDPVIVWAIRRHIVIRTEEDERTVRIDRYSTLEYEGREHRGT